VRNLYCPRVIRHSHGISLLVSELIHSNRKDGLDSKFMHPNKKDGLVIFDIFLTPMVRGVIMYDNRN
jgi:hypothetical protein